MIVIPRIYHTKPGYRVNTCARWVGYYPLRKAEDKPAKEKNIVIHTVDAMECR
jgi:hypothetical protein